MTRQGWYHALMVLSEPQAVAQSFSRAAENYDRWATAQQRIAERLLDFLPEELEGAKSENILDVGCGTGFLTSLLHRRYPKKRVHGIDIAPGMVEHCRRRWKSQSELSFFTENAEFFRSDVSYGLIASSCTAQWFLDSHRALKNLTQQLQPGGYWAAAIPVQGSFAELLHSYRISLGKEMPGLRLEDAHDYRRMLEQLGMEVLSQQTEPLEALYATAWKALSSFKGMGATFRRQPGYVSHTVGQLRRLTAHYQRRFTRKDGQVPLTYSVLYLVAKKI